MHSSYRIKTPFGLTLSALGLTLLTACGGGGGEEPSVTPAPTEEIATPSVVTICDVQATATTGPESHQVSPSQTVEIDGFSTQFSLVTSPAGYPYDGAPVRLSIPLEDLRDVAQRGYTPQSTLDSMGIETGSRFQAGSVGCVRGVSRVKNNGTDINPSYEFTWASETIANVPVNDVPNFAVNGFEFLNNFGTTAATAVFRMEKALVSDESAVRVCHVTSSQIDCLVPTVIDDGTQWVFTSPVAQTGVYVLSASQSALPAI